MKLNVICSKCNKGNLHLPEGYDGLADYYEIHCTKCSNVFTVHYTGMDNILEAHDYNSAVCKDVQVLNANGSWVGNSKDRFKAIDFDFNMLKGMRHIQTIEVYETLHYYQDGANFIQVCHNKIHKTINIYRYEAKPESIQTLMKHFFKTV